MFQELAESRSIDWAEYLDHFHAQHARITECLLTRAEASNIGTPYAWLASKLEPLIGDEHALVSILDIGCGSAPMNSVLPRHWKYLRIDISLSELRKAQQAGRKHVSVADATQLPLNANSMEAAISSMAMRLVTPLLPRDLLVGLRLITSLGALPALSQRFTERNVQGLLEGSGFVGICHERKRFSFSLRTYDDAKLLVDSLYLPSMTEERKLRAASKLASWASKIRDIPISVAMTVAMKCPSPTT